MRQITAVIAPSLAFLAGAMTASANVSGSWNAEAAAIDQIWSAGGRVDIDPGATGSGARFVDLSRVATANLSTALRAALVVDRVTALDLSNCRSVEMACGMLPRFRALRRLRLSRSAAGDAEMEPVSLCAGLEELDLSGTHVELQGLRALRRLPALKSLALPSRLGPGAWACLAQFPALTSLDLSGTDSSPQSLESLAHLPKLREVSMTCNRVGNMEMRALAALPALESLTVTGNFDNDGLRELASSPRLRRLHLGLTAHSLALGGRGLAVLAGLHDLEELELATTRLTLEQARPISLFTGLRTLGLHCELPDGRLEFARPLAHIRSLDLSDSNFNDLGLVDLDGLEDLVSLDLVNTEVSDAGLSRSRALERLRSLDLRGARSSGSILPKLATLPLLESLRPGADVTDDGAAALAKARKLRSLDLSGSRVTNVGVQSLAELRALHHLDLSGTGVKDGLPISRDAFPSLKRLDISAAGVSASFCARLRRSLGSGVEVLGG